MTDETKPRRGTRRPGGGRKPLPPGQKRTMREVYMAPVVWEAVEQNAKKFGLTVSAAVEEMVQASLERATGRPPTDA